MEQQPEAMSVPARSTTVEQKSAEYVVVLIPRCPHSQRPNPQEAVYYHREAVPEPGSVPTTPHLQLATKWPDWDGAVTFAKSVPIAGTPFSAVAAQAVSIDHSRKFVADGQLVIV